MGGGILGQGGQDAVKTLRGGGGSIALSGYSVASREIATGKWSAEMLSCVLGYARLH